MPLFRKTVPKRVRENLQAFQNARFDYQKFVRRQYLGKGCAYIFAAASRLGDIVSAYSVPGYEWINRDFSNYVEECAFFIPIEDAIVLAISGAQFSEAEQAVIRRVISDYFGAQLCETKSRLVENARRAALLLIIGAVSAALFILCSTALDVPLLRELVLVFSWFSLWEFLRLLIFDRRDLMRKKLEDGQLCQMRVEFGTEGTETEGER